MRFKLLLVLVFVFALFVAGCVPAYPGDGHLVVVDLDRDFFTNFIPRFGIFEADIVRLGIHYWDTVGARFRMREELSVTEEIEAKTARVLRVNHWTNESGDRAALYLPMNGELVVWTKEWYTTPLGIEQWSAIIAHEIGHSMGLNHVTEVDAVMFWTPADRADLSPADVREFFSHQR